MTRTVSFDLPETREPEAAQDDWEDVPEDEAEIAKTVAEEYETWKKNCPYMYDLVSSSALKWPSLTVQWLPEFSEKNGITTQQMILGSHTSDQEQNYLKLGSIDYPTDLSSAALESKPAQTDSRVKIIKKFPHEGEINKARYMPQSSETVATINGSGTVFIYNTSAPESSTPTALSFHSANGYGLHWSRQQQGKLVSGSDDRRVAVWDIPSGAKVPEKVFECHTDIINDVRWHNLDANLLCSVSDDRTLVVYDVRTAEPVNKIEAHSTGVNSVAFNHFSQYLLATGAEDETIALFDLRNLNQRLHSLVGHKKGVTSLEWSPFRAGVLGSASQKDCRVMIWDIGNIGYEQSQDDMDDGVPELVFMHAGHRAYVSDFSWNVPRYEGDCGLEWLIASVDDENIVQCWKIRDELTQAFDYGVADNTFVDVPEEKLEIVLKRK